MLREQRVARSNSVAQTNFSDGINSMARRLVMFSSRTHGDVWVNPDQVRYCYGYTSTQTQIVFTDSHSVTVDAPLDDVRNQLSAALG